MHVSFFITHSWMDVYLALHQIVGWEIIVVLIPFGDRGFKSGQAGTDGLGFWLGYDIQWILLYDMNVAIQPVHDS